MLVLDTNHLDALMFEHERRDRLVARIEAATGHTVATTIVVVQEKFEGWLSRINDSRITAAKELLSYAEMHRLVQFFGRWNVLPYDEACAIEYRRLKGLRIRGTGTHDLKIAATVLRHGAILLSTDNGFHNVPGLDVRDWLADDLEE